MRGKRRVAPHSYCGRYVVALLFRLRFTGKQTQSADAGPPFPPCHPPRNVPCSFRGVFLVQIRRCKLRCKPLYSNDLQPPPPRSSERGVSVWGGCHNSRVEVRFRFPLGLFSTYGRIAFLVAGCILWGVYIDQGHYVYFCQREVATGLEMSVCARVEVAFSKIVMESPLPPQRQARH